MLPLSPISDPGTMDRTWHFPSQFTALVMEGQIAHMRVASYAAFVCGKITEVARYRPLE